MKSNTGECGKLALVSRRELIQAAAAVAALGTAAPVLGKATPPPDKICYGKKDPQKNIYPVDDTNIYPLLAVWLLLTTNPTFVTNPDFNAIAEAVNLQPACVKAIFAHAQNQNTAKSFADVRTEFYDYVHAEGDYVPPGCPTNPGVITKIAMCAGVAVDRKNQRENA